MDKLSVELLGVIFDWVAAACATEKNSLTPLRLVCRAFDHGLRPYAMRCVQLDYSRLGRGISILDHAALQASGHLIYAAYVDMMIVRDAEELQRLNGVFTSLTTRIAEMGQVMDNLKRYCMGNSSFEEADYQREVKAIMQNASNLTSFKLNLPFQVVGSRSRTATFFLVAAMSCIRNRPEEHETLKRLVIENLTDKTVLDICRNPIDFGNIMTIFRGLKHLIISLKRQESNPGRQSLFATNFWVLIEKATSLESLCLIGWNAKRCPSRVNFQDVSIELWDMRSLPFPSISAGNLKGLRCLELKRVDMDGVALYSLLEQVSATLKELYLIEVHLKVRSPILSPGNGDTSLWIGLPGKSPPMPHVWLAYDLHRLDGFCLNILRVHELGYDDMQPLITSATSATYDLHDPTSKQRCFDERFVDAVMLGPDITEAIPTVFPFPVDRSDGIFPIFPTTEPYDEKSRRRKELHRRIENRRRNRFDACGYQTYCKNTTSWFQRRVDDVFSNHNRVAINELQNMIDVADRGMSVIESEIHDATH